MPSSSTSQKKAAGIRAKCMQLISEVEQAIGSTLQKHIEALDESVREMSEHCVSFSAGSDKSSIGSDADFIQAIDVDKMNDGLKKTVKDNEALIKLRSMVNDPKDGADILKEAENAMLKAKGQINRAAMINLMDRPTIHHKQKGANLRAVLANVLKTVDQFKLQAHIGNDLLAKASIIVEDKSADANEAAPEATAEDKSDRRRRGTEDTGAAPTNKGNGKNRRAK